MSLPKLNEAHPTNNYIRSKDICYKTKSKLVLLQRTDSGSTLREQPFLVVYVYVRAFLIFDNGLFTYSNHNEQTEASQVCNVHNNSHLSIIGCIVQNIYVSMKQIHNE